MDVTETVDEPAMLKKAAAQMTVFLTGMFTMGDRLCCTKAR